MSEWISVKDRLPDQDTWIIGGNPQRVEFGVWLGENQQEHIILSLPHINYMSIGITHWMPLPNPPKE